MEAVVISLAIIIYIALVFLLSKVCGLNDAQRKSRFQDSPPPQCKTDDRFALRRTPRTLDNLRRG